MECSSEKKNVEVNISACWGGDHPPGEGFVCNFKKIIKIWTFRSN